MGVEADGDPQLGRRLPEGVVAAVVEVAAAVGVRADEDAAEAELAHAAARLGDRGVDLDHGDGADADQALRRRGAVVAEPVIIRAAETPGDLGRRVADGEADGGVEDGDVDPLRVHVREARAAVEGARGAVLVADLAGEHVVGAPADRAREPEETAHGSRDRVGPHRLRVVLGGQDAHAGGRVGDEDQRSELRLEVARPHGARLEDVAVRVDHGADRVSCHGGASFRRRRIRARSRTVASGSTARSSSSSDPVSTTP